jgi:hypothetical protein
MSAYPRDCLTGDGEGFVRIIDGSRNDTPAQIVADFCVGSRNKHHPTLHVSSPEVKRGTPIFCVKTIFVV